MFEVSISMLGSFSSLTIFLKIYISKKFLTLLFFSYRKTKVINSIAKNKAIDTFITFLLFSSFLGPFFSPPGYSVKHIILHRLHLLN